MNDLSDMDMKVYEIKIKKKSSKRKKYILDILPSFFKEEFETYENLKDDRAGYYDSAKGYLCEARRAFAFAEKERIMKDREGAAGWLENAIEMLQEAEFARNKARDLTKTIKRRYTNG